MPGNRPDKTSADFNNIRASGLMATLLIASQGPCQCCMNREHGQRALIRHARWIFPLRAKSGGMVAALMFGGIVTFAYNILATAMGANEEAAA